MTCTVDNGLKTSCERRGVAASALGRRRPARSRDPLISPSPSASFAERAGFETNRLRVSYGRVPARQSVRPRAQLERDMNLISAADALAHIEVVEPDPEHCSSGALPPEGNVKLRNYRLIHENIRMYSPSGDDTSPSKEKSVSKFDVCSNLSPPRAKILELLRPEDPERETLEAIVRPIPRRGLVRPLDEDTRRFLQRALSSPNAINSSNVSSDSRLQAAHQNETDKSNATQTNNSKAERSLADELREAEQDEQSGSNIRRELLREFRRRGGGVKEALERERMGKLALSVEDDEEYEDNGLTAAARRLDQLLAESRTLHEELAGIHEDIQAESARASRCAAAARALRAESRALRYLDDVVALLKGDVAAAVRAKAWPFALGRREPGRNYIV
ncbi:uncharacterized protein [Epargyreus clarus]|uniref:uncharacterized protein n=1 Tax=Epargyreus clarus TaxID=520877 RepID=UPI003C2BB294